MTERNLVEGKTCWKGTEGKRGRTEGEGRRDERDQV